MVFDLFVSRPNTWRETINRKLKLNSLESTSAMHDHVVTLSENLQIGLGVFYLLVR